MLHGDCCGADDIQLQDFDSDSISADLYSQRQPTGGESFNHDDDFVDKNESFDIEFNNETSGDGRGIELEAGWMRSGQCWGRSLRPHSGRLLSSSQCYCEPPEPFYSHRGRRPLGGHPWRSRARSFKRGNNRFFRGDRVYRERGFRAREGRPFRKSRGQYSHRRDAPWPPSSDAQQKSGSGVVWYAGPRCSLIQDSDTGDLVFMYNSAMQPQDTEVIQNMEVLYGAFYDKKFIKKHNLTTFWEAAWVEVYEDEMESYGDEMEPNSAECSRSPIGASELNRVCSPKMTAMSSMINKSPAHEIVQKESAGIQKRAVEEEASSKEPTNADRDEATDEDGEGDDNAVEKVADKTTTTQSAVSMFDEEMMWE